MHGTMNDGGYCPDPARFEEYHKGHQAGYAEGIRQAISVRDMGILAKGPTIIVNEKPPPKLSKRVVCFLARFDMWVGAHWDKRWKLLYICPLPCCVIRISFRSKSP